MLDKKQQKEKINQFAKKYWSGVTVTKDKVTAYRIAQEMKNEGLCKYDMDCYRKLLSGVERLYRDKSA